MIKPLRFVTTVILAAMSMYSHAFEYHIVSNEPDSTLNGMTVRLQNMSEHKVPYSGVIENGVIDIKGESDRTFPAILQVVYNGKENKKSYMCYMVIEPGTIAIDFNNNLPLSGGELNDRLKAYHDRLSEAKGTSEISSDITKDIIRQNVGNGLGEYALLLYSFNCSPSEWTDQIELFDEEVRNMSAFDDISGIKRRSEPVWDGQPFRDLEGQTLDGEPAKLSDYVGKGHFVLADLWASWCKPCIMMAQHLLLPLYNEYKDNPDIQFLGIAMDDVSKIVRTHDVPWQQIMNCKTLRGTYIVHAIPELILFGPDGTIIKRHVNHGDILSLKQFLDDQLSRHNHN